MAVRKLARSWQFDFTLEGHGRHRKGGFRTKAEALEAERQRRADLIAGRKRFSFAEAYEMYMSATHMKALSRDHWERCWPDIKPILGHLFIEEVDTLAMDRLRNSLPKEQAPSSRNHRLSLVRTILRFMWKRGLLALRPPRSTGAAPMSRGVTPRCATSCQRQVNGPRSPRSVAPQVLEMISRGDWIRTSDLMLPKHAHYQAVLHPVASSVNRWSGGWQLPEKRRELCGSFRAMADPVLCFWA